MKMSFPSRRIDLTKSTENCVEIPSLHPYLVCGHLEGGQEASLTYSILLFVIFLIVLFLEKLHRIYTKTKRSSSASLF